MAFLTINSDEQDSELTIKSLEQQRLELEKFEELKQCYQTAINYIKEEDIADATNVLLNLYETELFAFKSFDAKQLQKAVMKLILSLKTASSERQLTISLRGLELFPDEKYFWERCGEILIESQKFEEAICIYHFLFKNEPYSIDYLGKLVECLKKSFKFDLLEELKENLKSSNWIDEEIEKLFDWRSNFSLFFDGISSKNVDSNDLETLLIPFREINWTNYASILHAMASGNYTKIYKKQPFNPENYSILNGPCFIEILGNTSNSTISQNSLTNSLHDYSASSMEDVSKKRSLRRKESRTNQSIALKTEQTPADLLKNLKLFFNNNFDEQKLVDILCLTEISCLQLLDKNNIIKTNDSIDINSNYFTSESLNQRICQDNEIKKPLAQRIIELVIFFFVQSRQPHPEFPKSLSKPMIDLFNLFKIATLPWSILKNSLGVEGFCELILSVCEVNFSLKSELKDFSYELALYKNFSKSENIQFSLLECLIISDESLKLVQLEKLANDLDPKTCFFTRYSDVLPSLITRDKIFTSIKVMKLEKLIDKAEELCKNNQFTSALDLFGGDLFKIIKLYTGKIKLRLCKLALQCSDSLEFLSEAISELIKIHSELEISEFIDYATIFYKNVSSLAVPIEDILVISCLYWNIYSRKNLLQNGQISSLNDSFALFLNNLLLNLDSKPHSTEGLKFILTWMAQEKCFGALAGLVPLKLFSIFSSSEDFNDMKFAYSIIFSLLRFPNIFTIMDQENGFEEWDRSPIGLGSRDNPCPFLDQSQFFSISNLIRRIDEFIDQNETKIVISEPGFVSFVDWLKKQYIELANNNSGKHFFHCVSLNRNHIKHFLNSSLELHTQKQVLNPSRGHFELEGTESFRYLLNTRSDIVYSELQGRKKSFEILKTIRSDLKMSLALNVSDADVWKLLGACYHDAAVHFMSCEAEFIVNNSGKLKRCVKKSILSLKHGLTIDPKDQVTWMKLCDLIDWSLHEPSLLSTDPEIIKFICSIGCSCVQNVLPSIVLRDRWIAFLRLELFLRKSNVISDQPEKQLELLMEASMSACRAYSENVYESTALYMSLVKFYSRLSKLRISNKFSPDDVQKWLDQITVSLPSFLQLVERRQKGGDLNLLDNLDALNVLDRKKIFHSHLTASSWFSFKIFGDTQAGLNQLQQIFPFLKGVASSNSTQSQQKKSSSASLLQIYQNDHERPARFLIAGRRYLLQLVDFICQLESSKDLLTQFLKKLHYIRRTIIGFPEILAKATLAYLKCPEADPDVIEELIGSLKDAWKGKIPVEIKTELEEIEKRSSEPQ